MARIQIGDVVELKTEGGYAYALYTHEHNQYGSLLRVWDQQYEAPVDIRSLKFEIPPSFSCFFPLNAAVQERIVKVVGRALVPDSLSEFPIFRAGVLDPRTNKVSAWWLWDGKREWQIEQLTESERKFPIRGVWNDTLLLERIQQGWTAESDVV